MQSMIRIGLIVLAGFIPFAFALIFTLNAVDASRPVAQAATVALCGLGSAVAVTWYARSSRVE